MGQRERQGGGGRRRGCFAEPWGRAGWKKKVLPASSKELVPVGFCLGSPGIARLLQQTKVCLASPSSCSWVLQGRMEEPRSDHLHCSEVCERRGRFIRGHIWMSLAAPSTGPGVGSSSKVQIGKMSIQSNPSRISLVQRICSRAHSAPCAASC